MIVYIIQVVIIVLDSYLKQLSLRSKLWLCNCNSIKFAFLNFPCYIGHCMFYVNTVFCKTVLPSVLIKTGDLEELSILIYFSTPENITLTEVWRPLKMLSLFKWGCIMSLFVIIIHLFIWYGRHVCLCHWKVKKIDITRYLQSDLKSTHKNFLVVW